jgi:hypothetical protein
VAALGSICGGCGGRSLTVRNATGKAIEVRVVHDAFLSGDRVLGSARIAADATESFGPFQGVPMLDPVDVEVMFQSSVGDVPVKHRVDKRNVSLVVEPAGLETWSGLAIRREDKRFR